jgi:transcription initiation factor TFIIE subunit alpha
MDQQEKYSQEISQSLEYEEQNMFFACPNGCRYNFDEASEHNFKCPECDHSPLAITDSQIICPSCKHHWIISEGIYDFRGDDS